MSAVVVPFVGCVVTFDDGTVIHMSLRDGLRLLARLRAEGWELA